jgi:hypothetical protein
VREEMIKFEAPARAYDFAIPRPMPREPPAIRTVKFGGSFTVEGSVGPEGVWCCGGAN